MKIRTFCGRLAAAVLLLAASFAVLPAAVWAEDTIKIGAIFSVTGPAAFLGAPEQKTAMMLVDDINKNGGINGMKVKLIVKDSGGSPEKAISFAKQLIEEEKVVAIIGPTTSGESMAIKDLCEKSKMPLISCAAAEGIVDPVAKYVFKTPQKDSFVVKWIYQTMKKKGVKKVAVLSSNTGFGAGGKAQLEKFAKEFGITIVISEVYDKAALDLSALLTKVKSTDAQAIVNWSIEPAQSIIAKNMKQLGMTLPLYQSHGFGNIKYVQSIGEAADGIIFPCGRLLVAEELSDKNPQKALLMKYKADYEKAFEEDVSTFGGHAYDAVLILKTAIENAKSADGGKIVAAIEKIKNLPGTAGVFNFSEKDHNGLGMDSIEMLTVKNGKFALYTEK